MSGWSWLILHNFLNLHKQATDSLSESLLLSGPRTGTSSREPRFTAWLCLGISKPKTSNSHLRLLYSSDRVALCKTQVACLIWDTPVGGPSGHLQTTSEHHYPVPAQLILHRGQRLVISGHSQSLQLTGLGKSFPLFCQQQPRPNYKRRMCLAHMMGSSQYPAWVIGEAVPLDHKELQR